MNQPWIYMRSPSWSPPPTSICIPSLWVIPVHQARALVSCIQPGLAICFTLDNIHVSMLFSQIISPSPSPIESKSLFYTSVSLSVLHIGLSLPSFWIPYICVSILYWCLSFFDCNTQGSNLTLNIGCFLVAKLCLTLCNPMNFSMPGFSVLHYLLEFPQTHVHWVDNAIQPSHLLSPPSPPTLNLS